MKEVRRKSADPAVNQLLIKAYRQQDELTWDRRDAMQPQDGFGRLGLSCMDCSEGPCRVSPFEVLDQETICGKDKHDLAAGNLLRRVQDGAAALLRLALDRGIEVDAAACRAACFAGDGMPSRDSLAARLREAGEQIGSLITALSQADEARSSVPAAVPVNNGALKADAANVMLLGHVHPEFATRLKERSANVEASLNLLCVCGNEGHAAHPSLLTNYVSQELPLLTGAVDMLAFGRQCVMPATVRLAERLGIPTVYAADPLDDKAAEQALAQATAHLRKRGSSVDIPDFTEQAIVGCTPAVIEALRASHSKGLCKGLVYVGGCGTLHHTQDADLVALAKDLLNNGFMVAASGCTGTALAKAGLCRADCAVPLTFSLPEGVPPVLHLGVCYDGRVVRELARALNGMPVFIAMPELTHDKPLALAVALGALGLPVFVGARAVPGLSADDMGTVLTPVEDFAQLPTLLAGRCS